MLDRLARAAYPPLLMAISESETPRRPLLWWGLAAAALVVGYADLARGGTTFAPVLLVLGYCVLVPIAILK
jgi:hypothetical protein